MSNPFRSDPRLWKPVTFFPPERTMPLHRKFIYGIGLILFTAILAVLVAGCSAEQLEKFAKGADETAYVMGGTPTTQPTSHTAAAESAHNGFVAGRAVIRAVAPPFDDMIALAVLVASAAGVIARRIGKNQGRNEVIPQLNAQAAKTSAAHDTIGEILKESTGFINPLEPWTPTTTKVLADLGHIAEAYVALQPTDPKA